MSGDDCEAYVDAALALAGLTLEAESRAAVVANTRVLRAMAAQFVDIPLPADLDPAAVLRL